MTNKLFRIHSSRPSALRPWILLVFGLIIAHLGRPVLAEIPVIINYTDDSGEGFYHLSLGESRRNAFEFAVNIWASHLEGTIPLEINAQFNPMGGSATEATLGMTGPSLVNRDFDGAPLENTWYVPALANQLHGEDILPSDDDIEAEFNSDIDNNVVLGDNHWYYGLDANPPNNDVDFVSVALHELAHGLGFLDLFEPTTGRWFSDTPDIFGLQLTQPGVGDFDTISRVDRQAALTSDNLFWNGPAVVAEHGNMVKMYAPDPYVSGSSISHWDPSNTPDLLMEPFARAPSHGLDLTLKALADLGWSVKADAPPDTAVRIWHIYQ